jgi:hypothetical protein
MVRGGGFGGGFGGGAQLMDMFGAFMSMPGMDLLRFGIGLLLILIIIMQIRSIPPARPPRVARRSTTCLICHQELDVARTYVDRYFPNWVACASCYEELSPVKQRQYRAE